VRVRYDMSHVQLGRDDPDAIDLSHLPDWLEPQIREVLRSMDHANKATNADPPINIKNHLEVDIPDVAEGEEWKFDIGGGEIVS
jgi:hypothetical protein